jgi:hypothetical protein
MKKDIPGRAASSSAAVLSGWINGSIYAIMHQDAFLHKWSRQ